MAIKYGTLPPGPLPEILLERYAQLAGEIDELIGGEGNWEIVVERAPGGGFTVGLDRNGGQVSIARTFDPDFGRIRHGYFSINESLQGRGISSPVMRATLDVVERVDWKVPPQISINANIEVGGYAWARRGFVPDKLDSWLDQIQYVAEDLGQSELYEELAARVAGLTKAQQAAFFTSDEFRKYKPITLRTDWDGKADLSDPVVLRALGRGTEGRAATSAATPGPDAPSEPLRPIDLAIRRQVLIERFKAAQVLDFDETLRAIDADIRARLSGDNLTEFSRTRLQKQMDELSAILARRYSTYVGRAMGQLRELSDDEIEQAGLGLELMMRAGAAATVAVPASQQVWAAVTARPLGVRSPSGELLLEPFMRTWGESEARSIASAIQQGYYEGENNQQILNRIRGTRALQYSDGLLAVSRRHAEAVVRTAIQHVVNVARNEVYAANDDIVEGYQWVATLDSRTSPTCRSLDGQKFEIGKGPLPPAHIACRSATIPNLHPALAMLSEGATRASADGYVAGETTYYEWLKGQDAAFQDVAIGATRGKLLRDGGLGAEKFGQLNLGRNFQPLTLAQMRKLNPRAFKRAGV